MKGAWEVPAGSTWPFRMTVQPPGAFLHRFLARPEASRQYAQGLSSVVGVIS